MIWEAGEKSEMNLFFPREGVFIFFPLGEAFLNFLSLGEDFSRKRAFEIYFSWRKAFEMFFSISSRLPQIINGHPLNSGFH